MKIIAQKITPTDLTLFFSDIETVIMTIFFFVFFSTSEEIINRLNTLNLSIVSPKCVYTKKFEVNRSA